MPELRSIYRAPPPIKTGPDSSLVELLADPTTAIDERAPVLPSEPVPRWVLEQMFGGATMAQQILESLRPEVHNLSLLHPKRYEGLLHEACAIFQHLAKQAHSDFARERLHSTSQRLERENECRGLLETQRYLSQPG